MNRTESVLSIRPEISVDTSLSADAESFMHKTLRPVLKLQHELIINVFQHYLTTNGINFAGQSTDQKVKTIHSVLKHDQKFKIFLTGLCCGLFTETELRFYLSNQSEINKRIIEMLIKRIESAVMI
jgi:hypothetical protein